jgi:hypothetical protein
MLFAAAGLLTTGVFTSPYLVSVLAGLDPGQPTDMAAWRHYTVDFVLAAICIKPSASPGLRRTPSRNAASTMTALT